MVPPDEPSWIVHVTDVSIAPVTVAVNCWLALAERLTALGDIEMVTEAKERDGESKNIGARRRNQTDRGWERRLLTGNGIGRRILQAIAAEVARTSASYSVVGGTGKKRRRRQPWREARGLNGRKRCGSIRNQGGR
jgi:hypothetical protein